MGWERGRAKSTLSMSASGAFFRSSQEGAKKGLGGGGTHLHRVAFQLSPWLYLLVIFIPAVLLVHCEFWFVSSLYHAQDGGGFIFSYTFHSWQIHSYGKLEVIYAFGICLSL